MSRFSRASVTKEIQDRIDSIQARRGFDPGNGWAQIREADHETHRDYGECYALCGLADELELQVNKRGRSKERTFYAS